MEEERINTGKSTEMELKVYFAITYHHHHHHHHHHIGTPLKHLPK